MLEKHNKFCAVLMLTKKNKSKILKKMVLASES